MKGGLLNKMGNHLTITTGLYFEMYKVTLLPFLYLCAVQPKYKILSVPLLVIYLLVFLQSITSPLPPESLYHHHQDYESVHHEHTFHIGIFHFLGHLLEKITQQDDLTDDYLQPELILPKKQSEDDFQIADFDLFIYKTTLAESDVNIHGPPDFPIYFFRLKNAHFTANPLRAPPAVS